MRAPSCAFQAFGQGDLVPEEEGVGLRFSLSWVVVRVSAGSGWPCTGF